MHASSLLRVRVRLIACGALLVVLGLAAGCSSASSSGGSVGEVDGGAGATDALARAWSAYDQGDPAAADAICERILLASDDQQAWLGALYLSGMCAAVQQQPSNARQRAERLRVADDHAARTAAIQATYLHAAGETSWSHYLAASADAALPALGTVARLQFDGPAPELVGSGTVDSLDAHVLRTGDTREVVLVSAVDWSAQRYEMAGAWLLEHTATGDVHAVAHLDPPPADDDAEWLIEAVQAARARRAKWQTLMVEIGTAETGRVGPAVVEMEALHREGPLDATVVQGLVIGYANLLLHADLRPEYAHAATVGACRAMAQLDRAPIETDHEVTMLAGYVIGRAFIAYVVGDYPTVAAALAQHGDDLHPLFPQLRAALTLVGATEFEELPPPDDTAPPSLKLYRNVSGPAADGILQQELVAVGPGGGHVMAVMRQRTGVGDETRRYIYSYEYGREELREVCGDEPISPAHLRELWLSAWAR